MCNVFLYSNRVLCLKVFWAYFRLWSISVVRSTLHVNVNWQNNPPQTTKNCRLVESRGRASIFILVSYTKKRCKHAGKSISRQDDPHETTKSHWVRSSSWKPPVHPPAQQQLLPEELRTPGPVGPAGSNGGSNGDEFWSNYVGNYSFYFFLLLFFCIYIYTYMQYKMSSWYASDMPFCSGMHAVFAKTCKQPIFNKKHPKLWITEPAKKGS